MTTRWIIGAAAAALLLAGCGGGGASDPAPEPPAATNEVPAAALVSTAALVDWGKALPASDTADPLDLTMAMPPTSETEEPREL